VEDDSDQESIESARQPPITKPQKKSLIRILIIILDMDEAYHSKSPADPIKLNLPDYFSKVKRPMDLGTIMDTLQQDGYSSLSSFFKDFDQVLHNSVVYNGEYHEITECAREMHRRFDCSQAYLPHDTPTSAQIQGIYARRAGWRKARGARTLRRVKSIKRGIRRDIQSTRPRDEIHRYTTVFNTIIPISWFFFFHFSLTLCHILSALKFVTSIKSLPKDIRNTYTSN